MILKTLTLENIRSYQKETIDFPLGRTLFEGDVGSGKSSILSAIEFVLFGLGDQKGSSLLRIGSKDGSVKLLFAVNGQNYEVYRTLLRKGRAVRQGEGYILRKRRKKPLTASELKYEILKILYFF